MQTLLISTAVLVSLLLIVVVLIQKSKGGGLASNFAGSNQIMGVRRTNNFIEKATWTLAIIICFLSLLSGILLSRSKNNGANQSIVKDVPAVEQTVGTFDTPVENETTEIPAITDGVDAATTPEATETATQGE